MEDRLFREILSQPDVWRRTLSRILSKSSPLGKIDSLIGNRPLLFTGCGSSYYLSLAVASMWRGLVGDRTLALSASDVMMHPESCFARGETGTVVGISRSGTTPETLEAVRLLRRSFGWHAAGVTCHDGTGLVDECEYALILAEAAETSRFTTRALTTTVLALQTLAAVRMKNPDLEAELRRLPDLADGLLPRYGASVKDAATRGGYNRFIYLGQGPYFGFARELMLKTQEIVRIPAEACETLEYLHGPHFSADPSTLITVILSDYGAPYQLDALAKIKMAGAKVAVVCEKLSPEVAAGTDFVIELNSGLSDYGRMLLVMPPMQLFIYHRAVATGRSAWIKEMVISSRSPA